MDSERDEKGLKFFSGPPIIRIKGQRTVKRKLEREWRKEIKMGRFYYIDGIPYRLVMDKETGGTVLEPVPSEARKNNAKRRKDNRREAKLDREWADDE